MCGIIGYVGNKNAKDVIISGLYALEYRGYDSSGIAYYTKNKLKIPKSARYFSADARPVPCASWLFPTKHLSDIWL